MLTSVFVGRVVSCREMKFALLRRTRFAFEHKIFYNSTELFFPSNDVRSSYSKIDFRVGNFRNVPIGQPIVELKCSCMFELIRTKFIVQKCTSNEVTRSHDEKLIGGVRSNCLNKLENSNRN